MGFEYTLLIMAFLFVLGGLLNLFLTARVIELDKAIMPSTVFNLIRSIGIVNPGFVRFVGCLALLAGVIIAGYAIISIMNNH
jgi:hypothetical protein